MKPQGAAGVVTSAAPSRSAQRPLAGYRVLDLAGPSGLHCGKLLADMGAGVLRVEPPGGDPGRRLPPFVAGVPGPDRSLSFLHYHTNKRSITLNLATQDGRAILRELAKTADVVLETQRPGALDAQDLGYAALSAINPRIVVASITPFGQTGPWRDYQATDIAAFALGNTMALSGEPGESPLQAPGELAYGMTGAYAAYAISLALFHRLTSGRGQHVDASLHECAVHIAGYAIPNYSHTHVKPFRSSRKARGGDVYNLYRCQDGHVLLFILPFEQWKRMVEWLGNPPELTDPVFEDVVFRRSNNDLIYPHIAAFCAPFTKQELYDEGQRRRIGISPVNRPGEFLESQHVRERQMLAPVEHPTAGPYTYFGPGVRVNGVPPSADRPAPRIGEHNAAVYCGELGFTPAELQRLAAIGVI